MVLHLAEQLSKLLTPLLKLRMNNFFYCKGLGPLTGIFMKKLYLKFVVTHFVLSAIMFCVWYLVAGIENAREMTFVISTLASCIAAKNLMEDTLKQKS